MKNALFLMMIVMSFSYSAVIGQSGPVKNKTEGVVDKTKNVSDDEYLQDKPELKLEENQVLIKTNLGDILLLLYPDEAPITVENFLQYVRSGFYKDTIFHRVIQKFMIQGGTYFANMTEKPTTRPAIDNEALNGVGNERGTIAMARMQEINSATSGFFINTVNNRGLNHTNMTPAGYGYAVFGRVIEGMDVVDKIAALKTGSRGFFQDVPLETVVILDAIAFEENE